MAKAAFNEKKALITSTLDLELRKKLVKCYIWSIALYGDELWTLRAVDQKQLESFEILCWRRMAKISWTEQVRNKEVLLRVKEQRNVLTYLLTPWSRVLLEQLTSKLCNYSRNSPHLWNPKVPHRTHK